MNLACRSLRQATGGDSPRRDAPNIFISGHFIVDARREEAMLLT
jgi:hypothetical protein